MNIYIYIFFFFFGDWPGQVLVDFLVAARPSHFWHRSRPNKLHPARILDYRYNEQHEGIRSGHGREAGLSMYDNTNTSVS